MADGFWLFDGLEEEPYGLLPLVNLAGKGGPTSTKYVDRVGSYQWLLAEDSATILVGFCIYWVVILSMKRTITNVY